MRKAVLILTLFLLAGLSQDVFARADADYDKAVRLYNSGKYKEAVNLLKEYSKNNPEPAAYYRTGYALYKLGRYDEANEYFREAYLLSPTFTPEKVGDYEKYKKARARAEAPKKEAGAPKPAAPAKEAPPPVQPQAQAKPPVPAQQQPAQAPQQVKPPVSVPAQTAQPAAAAPPPQAQAPVVPAPPVKMPPAPMMQPTDMPGGISGIIGAMVAGFAMVFLVLILAVYLFFSFCLFKIAKKLDVPAAWTAWVPIVQTWTWVACAGKPWWWVLLLLVPIVNFFLSIYLWMCIAENLGRNKWLGLLILVPLINLGFVGWLAFSKGEIAPVSGEEAEIQ